MKKIFLNFVLSIFIIGLTGCAKSPDIVVYNYNYQAKPPALAPGTPPSSPNTPPEAVDYQTIYGSAFDDPSLVIFKNETYRQIRIQIDGGKPIILEAYAATADLHLGPGNHQIRVIIEKSTAAHGTWQTTYLIPVWIRPEGRSQIFNIRDPSSDDYGWTW